LVINTVMRRKDSQVDLQKCVVEAYAVNERGNRTVKYASSKEVYSKNIHILQTKKIDHMHLPVNTVKVLHRLLALLF